MNVAFLRGQAVKRQRSVDHIGYFNRRQICVFIIIKCL